MDSADSFSSETWREKTDEPVIARVASEVLLLVPGDVKNARYLQALWLLDHINETVTVKCPSEVSLIMKLQVIFLICMKSMFLFHLSIDLPELPPLLC